MEHSYYTLTLNSDNLVSNNFNNTYRYNFPQGAVKFKDTKVALKKLTIYYSWDNITQAYNNNTFDIIWPIGAGTSTYSITVTDGFYDIPTLNSYMQQFFITNGLYLINASGDYVYYAEFVTNSTYYSIQFNAYPIPTALPAGWSQPSNWPGYPAVGYTPQLVVSANAFRSITGINAGTYPSPQQTTNFSKLSDVTPQVSVVQSVLVTCNLLNNRYALPNTVLDSFSPANAAFGTVIDYQPPEHTYVDVGDGNYPYFEVIFYDQNFNQFTINDTNLVIILVMRAPGKGVSY